MHTEQKYIQNLYKDYMFPPDRIPLIVSNTILAGYFFGESGLAIVSLFMPIYFLFETLGFGINYGGLIKTLEEISEIMSAVSLGHLDAPCILYNHKGYYDDLKKQLQKMIREGFSDSGRQSRIFFADDISQIIRILQEQNLK